MGFLELIVYIAVLGALVWAITTLIEMPEKFKKAIYVIATLALIYIVLNAFGLLTHFHDVKIPGTK